MMTQTQTQTQTQYIQVLAIDPSIRALGYALFSLNITRKKSQLHLPIPGSPIYLESGVLTLAPAMAMLAQSKINPSLTGSASAWIAKADCMVKRLRELFPPVPPLQRVLIELPRHFPSLKGQAAQQSSAILKLMFLVSALRAEYQNQQENIEVHLISVNRWKGTVPKSITQRRVQKHWQLPPSLTDDHNEWDAIGIGDFYLRRALQLKPTAFSPR